jgi:23S rRNA U2552 (ribose-2'-O)-methylase RlmE/FtsJ
MNFCLNIENDNNKINKVIKFNNIQIDIINKESNLLFKKYYNKVSVEKEKIDKLENVENWDKMKKIGNPYELIYTTYNKKRKNDSISLYIPISRSYFKMWEIFYNFDFFKYFNIKKNFVFSHLAEGPGGFLEATYNYRKNINKQNNDNFYGITLKPTNEHIPCFTKIKKIFNDNENIKINYGNLYVLNDVKTYLENFQGNNKAHLVTADGGFDYSSNFNGQEINSCQIIYSECIISLNILRKNGCFVCKVFDLFSITMVQILYIMYCCFENIYIYKPETSRPANSEKYLICMYYKDNLSYNDKQNLLNIIENWYDLLDEKLFEDELSLSIIFKNIKIDNLFVRKLSEYNEKYIENQMFYLNNTIELSQKKIDKDKYYEIIQNQVSKAIEWCKKYNIDINKNSIYYKKNIF